MSIIHIGQIQKKVKDFFESKIDKSDIKDNDLERDIKITSRCLAAYAVYMSTTCSVEDAALSIVDGADDNGIDALYYSPLSNQMILVQSKFSKDGKGEPVLGDVSKYVNGVRDLINLRFERFNKKIRAKESIIEQALSNYETHYIIILIDTYASAELAKHSKRLIDDLLSELNNTGDEYSDNIVDFLRLNQGRIHASLAQKAVSSPINIEIGVNNWGVINEPFKAYYGSVSAVEIANWWKLYKNRLFDKNIRQVLGRTDVNEEMEKTIRESPLYFWYYNNGITIIADKIDKALAGGTNREIGSFKLSNIAIVNGAQTVSTIGKYAQQYQTTDNLSEILVQVRMIQLTDSPAEFGNSVTKSNNRQNRIENRDFASQDPEQIRLKSELAIDGIEYSIVRSEKAVYDIEKYFNLLDATVALACASGKVSLAVQVKSGIGKFYENLNKGIYKELFNPQTECYYLYNCVKIVRIIEAILQNKINGLGKKSGKKYLLYTHGNRIIEMFVLKIEFKPTELKQKELNIDRLQISKCIDNVIPLMEEFIFSNYPDNFLATLFKNNTKCVEMDDYVITKWSSCRSS